MVSWQIWLACGGPLYEVFRAFCRRVRSITTDMGVEHRIVSFANVSQDVFRCIDPRAREHPDGDTHLFPRAICIPGWNAHMIY